MAVLAYSLSSSECERRFSSSVMMCPVKSLSLSTWSATAALYRDQCLKVGNNSTSNAVGAFTAHVKIGFAWAWVVSKK